MRPRIRKILNQEALYALCGVTLLLSKDLNNLNEFTRWGGQQQASLCYHLVSWLIQYNNGHVTLTSLAVFEVSPSFSQSLSPVSVVLSPMGVSQDDRLSEPSWIPESVLDVASLIVDVENNWLTKCWIYKFKQKHKSLLNRFPAIYDWLNLLIYGLDESFILNSSPMTVANL